jgi:putative endonuclease
MIESPTMNERFFVYILECSDRSYYVGSTNNVDERARRHNSGEAAEWTKNRSPVKVVYQEKHDSLLSARQREKQIKKCSREKKKKLISGVWKKQ